MKSESEGIGPVHRLWLRVERLANSFCTPELNPFYYLGAIGIFFLWVILVSGVYLFIFYEISRDGAYQSIEWLVHEQWYLGGFMRSLHHYAASGLVIVMLLHALRCFVLKRYAHWRWIAWVSGVAIAWIVWAGGIFGYWMVWDDRAQLVAVLSAEMIENVPIFGLPLSLNFARPENLADNFFYIILFIHFASILVVFIIFLLLHLGRISKAMIHPPRKMMYSLFVVLLVVSALNPAVSGGSANLEVLSGEIPFDWFFLFIYPLLNYMSVPSL
ncbi:MAG: cytochrome b N-terminal domain-containing protein, partial [Thermodesulfobacteriota bacterium]